MSVYEAPNQHSPAILGNSQGVGEREIKTASLASGSRRTIWLFMTSIRTLLTFIAT